MILESVEKALALANKEYSISQHKVHAIVECAAMDAAILMEEAELKILTEAGSDDELCAYYEEASEGLIAKLKKSLTGIIESLKKFFSALKDKVISIFKKKEVEDSIKDIGLKAKLPFFKTKKVEIKDVEKEEAVLAKWKAKMQSLVARVKSGGKVEKEEIQTAKESFLKEHAVAAGAVITVTLAAAIALLLKYHKKMDTDINATEKDITEEAAKLMEISGIDENSIVEVIDVVNAAAAVNKESGNFCIKSVTSLLTAIKGIAGKTDINDDGGKVEESADEDSNIFDSNEFAFMKESGSEEVKNNTEYNSDWIKSVFK